MLAAHNYNYNLLLYMLYILLFLLCYNYHKSQSCFHYKFQCYIAAKSLSLNSDMSKHKT